MVSEKNRLWDIVIAALVTISLGVPILHAMPVNLSLLTGEKFTAAIGEVNFSAPGPSRPAGDYDIIFQTIPLYKAELNDTTLPGPRYMAYGPMAITLAVSPSALIIMTLIVSLCGVVIYILRRRKLQDGAESLSEKEQE